MAKLKNYNDEITKLIDDTNEYIKNCICDLQTDVTSTYSELLSKESDILGCLFHLDGTYLKLLKQSAYKFFNKNRNKSFSYDENGNVITIKREPGFIIAEDIYLSTILYIDMVLIYRNITKGYSNQSRLNSLEFNYTFEQMREMANTLIEQNKLYVANAESASKIFTYDQSIVRPYVSKLNEKDFYGFYAFCSAVYEQTHELTGDKDLDNRLREYYDITYGSDIQSIIEQIKWHDDRYYKNQSAKGSRVRN